MLAKFPSIIGDGCFKLEQVFSVLRAHGLRNNPAECVFAALSLEFLDHSVWSLTRPFSGHRISKTPQRFIGVINPFVPPATFWDKFYRNLQGMLIMVKMEFNCGYIDSQKVYEQNVSGQNVLVTKCIGDITYRDNKYRLHNASATKHIVRKTYQLHITCRLYNISAVKIATENVSAAIQI